MSVQIIPIVGFKIAKSIELEKTRSEFKSLTTTYQNTKNDLQNAKNLTTKLNRKYLQSK
jgi:hypothetical protein